MLNLVIPKGRMLDVCLKHIEKAGLILNGERPDDRCLSFPLNNGITLFIVRNTDILTYIKNNIADIAFIGSDMLLEEKEGSKEVNYYNYGDIGLTSCRLMTAGKRVNHNSIPPRLRVATKYERIAAKFYASKGIQADIIKINGSVELAAATGFADQIVDIVDTGRTLKDNNLIPLEKITDVSTRLIINKGALKSKWREINPLLKSLIPCSH